MMRKGTHPAASAAQRGNVSSKQPSMRDTFPLSLQGGDVFRSSPGRAGFQPASGQDGRFPRPRVRQGVRRAGFQPAGGQDGRSRRLG